MISKLNEMVVIHEGDASKIFYHANHARLFAIKAMNKLKKVGPRKYKEIISDLHASVQFSETALKFWPDFEPPLDGS